MSIWNSNLCGLNDVININSNNFFIQEGLNDYYEEQFTKEVIMKNQNKYGYFVKLNIPEIDKKKYFQNKLEKITDIDCFLEEMVKDKDFFSIAMEELLKENVKRTI